MKITLPKNLATSAPHNIGRNQTPTSRLLDVKTLTALSGIFLISAARTSPRDHLAVDIARSCHHGGQALNLRYPGLAVVDTCCTASRGSSRDAGVTHRRQGAADNSLCSRDEAVHTANLKALAEFQATHANDYRQQADYDALCHDHFPPFAEKMAGISLNSGT
jgi:hypothetical protein